MASKGDYFGLGRLVSIILAIIPITAWICGIITRIQEGKIVAHHKNPGRQDRCGNCPRVPRRLDCLGH